jgi:hypothetical protein
MIIKLAKVALQCTVADFTVNGVGLYDYAATLINYVWTYGTVLFYCVQCSVNMTKLGGRAVAEIWTALSIYLFIQCFYTVICCKLTHFINIFLWRTFFFRRGQMIHRGEREVISIIAIYYDKEAIYMDLLATLRWREF